MDFNTFLDRIKDFKKIEKFTKFKYIKLEKEKLDLRNKILEDVYKFIKEYSEDMYPFHYFNHCFDKKIYLDQINLNEYYYHYKIILNWTTKLFFKKNNYNFIKNENLKIVELEVDLIKSLKNNIFPFFIWNFLKHFFNLIEVNDKFKNICFYLNEIIVLNKGFFYMNKFILLISILNFANKITENIKIKKFLNKIKLNQKFIRRYMNIINNTFKDEIFKKRSIITLIYYKNDVLF